MTTLFTMGYSAWKAEQRMAHMSRSLVDAGVTLVVDVRHSPCAADPTRRSAYGPKLWTLQCNDGIVAELAHVGIAYSWLPELGNPQKNDPQMTILRWQLTDAARSWPVHRGLAALSQLVSEGHSCCLLCGCDKYNHCHRRLIAEAFYEHWNARARLRVLNLAPHGPERVFPESDE
jgi:uncharacterized protein (DUF488 family)